MTAVGVLGPLLANVMSFRGDLAEAIAHARRALDLAEAAGDRQMELLAHVQLTLCHSYSGDAVAAVAHEDSVAACAAEMCSSTAHTRRPYVGGERRAERGDSDAARHLHAAQRTRRPRERHSRSVGSAERAARAGSGGAGARSARGQAVEAEEVVGDVEHVDAGEPGTCGVAMSSPGAVNVSATRSSITITVPCPPARASRRGPRRGRGGGYRDPARAGPGSGAWRAGAGVGDRRGLPGAAPVRTRCRRPGVGMTIVSPLADAGCRARGSGLEIALLVLGSVLLTRLATPGPRAGDRSHRREGRPHRPARPVRGGQAPPCADPGGHLGGAGLLRRRRAGPAAPRYPVERSHRPGHDPFEYQQPRGREQPPESGVRGGLAGGVASDEA